MVSLEDKCQRVLPMYFPKGPLNRDNVILIAPLYTICSIVKVMKICKCMKLRNHTSKTRLHLWFLGNI